MENDNSRLRQYHIHADITTVFKSALSVGWSHIRKNSVHRILYMSSVLYNFKLGHRDNPFRDYRFTVNGTGPYDSNIDKSISFLVKDEYIMVSLGSDELVLNNNVSLPSFRDMPEFDKRQEWIQLVVYILSIYTENRIYDFIFRDPQYQYAIKSNTQQGLNTQENNETVRTLNQFKEEFENAIVGQNVEMTNQQYVELYFEYVFSKILNRKF